MSQTLFSLAGFQVITIGRFWLIAEAWAHVSIARQNLSIRMYPSFLSFASFMTFLHFSPHQVNPAVVDMGDVVELSMSCGRGKRQASRNGES
jgi:hypothetical protein